MGKILVTGGTGYLIFRTWQRGSSLRATSPQCVDNLHSNPSSSRREGNLRRKSAIIKADAGDVAAMRALFAEYQIDAVIHFAGHKAVGESVAHPLMYYRNNYDSMLTILEMCLKHGSALVFSSSATVYGVPHSLPLTGPSLSARSPTVAPSCTSKRPSVTWRWRIPSSTSPSCATSTRSARTRSGLIGEKHNGITTTSCRSSARRRRVSGGCGCSAATSAS